MILSKELSEFTHNDQDVYAFTVQNSNGLSIRIMNYGATLLSVRMPDRKGTIASIEFVLLGILLIPILALRSDAMLTEYPRAGVS
jgi:hypothetical protein